MDKITFEYEGVLYTASLLAYELNRIVLPDRRILEADAWLESNPPMPNGLHEVPHTFTNLPPEEIAHLMNGVIAKVKAFL